MNAQDHVRQRTDSVHENPVRLDERKTEQIIDALQTNVYVLYHQVRKYH